MTLGDKIAGLRKEKKLTQKDLGELLGISRTAIGNIERGVSHVDELTLKQFMDIFGKDANYFLMNDSAQTEADGFALSAREKQIILRLRAIKKRGCSDIYDLCSHLMEVLEEEQQRADNMVEFPEPAQAAALRQKAHHKDGNY